MWKICQVLTIGKAPHADPSVEGHLRINTLFISDNVRQAVHEGRADFTPAFLSEVPLLFRNGRLPLDVALIYVSPPDEHGFCSLGIQAGLVKTPAQVARTVIAEVNEQMPRTLGRFLHPHFQDRLRHPGGLRVGRNAHGRDQRAEPGDRPPRSGTGRGRVDAPVGIGAVPDAILGFLGSKARSGDSTRRSSPTV